MATTTRYPELYKAPAIATGLGYDDPAARSQAANGLVITRARWTKVRRTWNVSYTYLPKADVDVLDSFVRETVFGGAGSFLFNVEAARPEEPNSGEVVEVRFSKAPSFQQQGWVNQPNSAYSGMSYSCSFSIEEV